LLKPQPAQHDQQRRPSPVGQQQRKMDKDFCVCHMKSSQHMPQQTNHQHSSTLWQTEANKRKEAWKTQGHLRRSKLTHPCVVRNTGKQQQGDQKRLCTLRQTQC